MRTSLCIAVVTTMMACSRHLPERMVKDTATTTAATVLAPAAPTEPAPARGFQRSYDEEALGHLDVALAALDDVKTDGDSVYVVDLRRGWLLYRLGKSPESVLSYKKAVADAPASVEARVGLLAPLATLRRWIDVEEAARDVLRKDPGNYQGTLRLAFALFSQARFADAAAAYRALLAAYPSDVDVADGLGWSLVKLGKQDEAAARFAHVLEIAPKNALALDGARAAAAR